MQEFSSISVSTYDPDALVGQLNDKAADGWDVVGIIPTGSTITAYLTREATGEATVGDDTSATSVVPEPAAEPSPAPEPAPAEEPAGEPGLPDAGIVAAAAAAAQAEPVAEPAPAEEPAGEPGLPHTDAIGTSAAAEPAAEPAPEPAAQPAAAQPAAAQPAAAQPAAATNAAPAGWYADPSGRFELRYWDGGTWTEHVSRAGQQYTDPPVA